MINHRKDHEYKDHASGWKKKVFKFSHSVTYMQHGYQLPSTTSMKKEATNYSQKNTP